MTDADKYTPEGQDVTTTVGGNPSASDGIKNKEDMPDGTTYEWESPVDTTTTGIKDGVVVVKYPDGSSERVPVKVIVTGTPSTTDADKYTPEGQDVTTTVGGNPSASDGIKNKEDMPDGTTYEWESPVDTSTPGIKEGVVIVKYPDGSSERVVVRVIVGTNDDYVAPTTPGTQKPTAPTQTKTDDTKAPVVKVTSNTGNTSEGKELPQMGNANNNALGLAGLGLLASSALIVAKGKKKRKNN